MAFDRWISGTALRLMMGVIPWTQAAGGLVGAYVAFTLCCAETSEECVPEARRGERLRIAT